MDGVRNKYEKWIMLTIISYYKKFSGIIFFNYILFNLVICIIVKYYTVYLNDFV